jgi:hypothetical protein
MRKILACLVGLAFVHGAQAQDDPSWSMLQQYCTECHNAIDWAGGWAFDTLTQEDIPADAKIWEAAVRKLRGNQMPPPGNPQPTQKQIETFIHWMEGTLDAKQHGPQAGHVPVQRLTRFEYANSVRDLLGVEIRVRELLPPETEVQGFDNVAAALSVSPAFVDQYVSAARVIANEAVGERAPKLANAFYPVQSSGQDYFVDGMPLGSRGGMRFRHTFPADGEYRFTINDLDIGLYPWAAETRHTLLLMIDGREVARRELGGAEDLALVDRGGAAGRRQIMDRFANIPARVSVGQHEVLVTFIERSFAESDEPADAEGGGGVSRSAFGAFARPRVPRLLDGVAINGPYGATDLSRSISRDRIFVCEPKAAAEERACARTIAENLARRAFRRPVGASEIDRLMPFYDAGRKEAGGFDAGVRQLVTAVLASPDFLYRAVPPSGQTRDGVQALTDLQLATRLAFFLWSQGPDEELLAAATRGELSQPAVLEAQVHRMLRDRRAEALVTEFAIRWLNLDELEAVDPDPKLFPRFDAALREDFYQEVRLLLDDVLLGDRSVLRLMDADYSFLNERLARHYGIANVHGPQFRRVPLPDPARFGLLGKGAVLTLTANPNRTAPVLRGVWIMERILGTPPATPPPNVPDLNAANTGGKPSTVREKTEIHRKNPACASCHAAMDPLGFALENFDTVGQFHAVDPQSRQPIDTAAVLPDGTPVAGPEDLHKALAARGDQLAQVITEKLMTYGVGRPVEYLDMPTVRRIVRTAAANNYRFEDIVLGVVNSAAFRRREPPAALPATKTAQAANLSTDVSSVP